MPHGLHGFIRGNTADTTMAQAVEPTLYRFINVMHNGSHAGRSVSEMDMAEQNAKIVRITVTLPGGD